MGLNDALMKGGEETLLSSNRGYSNGTAEAVGGGDVSAVRSSLQTAQEVHILVLWKR